eukprot:TRINITY_DN18739_c0_g1_i1.p1 TRINITY_DN18739_c0_g1~~TRINITY_DN18739_c0_g1_i1.p1  ORF type:complete len:821 (+),score=143.70 TRINITY_DN18739_c0_g1_i1:56-2518(+)
MHDSSLKRRRRRRRRKRVKKMRTALGIASCLVTCAAMSADRPWMDPSAPIPERVKALVSEMTLEEKVNQLLHVWVNVKDKDVLSKFGKTGLGAMYIQDLSSNSTCNIVPECRLAARNALQQKLMNESRLGIPITFITESLHSNYNSPERAKGMKDMEGSPLGTIFPMPITQGSSWNTSLIEAVASTIALEARSSGADRGFSPEIQVTTDPRFGRMQENFGADPTLVSAYARSGVWGTSGKGGGPNVYLDPNHLVSEAKHYAAYGFGDHDGAPADVSISKLYNVYLRPWKAYVEAGGRGAMAAHNSVNGDPCHSSSWLLTKILREELGCTDCFIGTDFNDINNLVVFNTANSTKYPNHPAATDGSIQAVTAGIDQDMGGTAFPSLLQAVQDNLVNVTFIDRAVSNVLRTKFAAGLFDHPITNLSRLSVVRSPAHIALAKEVAVQGTVLLQNPGGMLPFKPTGKIAVLGPNAGCPSDTPTLCDVSNNMVGGYSPTVAPGQVKTVLDSVKELNVNVVYEKGVDIDSFDVSGIAAAVNATKGAQAAIVVLGDSTNTCGEGSDRMELDVPGSQLDLLSAVLKVGVPVVAVMIAGRPSTFGEGRNSKYGPHNAMLSSPNLAVIEAWRPGEQGGPAIVDIIFGKRQPGGSLSAPFPRGSGNINTWGVPWFHERQGDYDWKTPSLPIDGSYDPLFCFGHGLRYSVFNITGFGAKSESVSRGGEFSLSVDITETVPYTKASGSVVVQIYYSQLTTSKRVRDVTNLAGFAKGIISSSGTILVDIPASDLGYTTWDGTTGKHEFTVDQGQYILYACLSSCHCTHNVTVTVL